MINGKLDDVFTLLMDMLNIPVNIMNVTVKNAQLNFTSIHPLESFKNIGDSRKRKKERADKNETEKRNTN